MFLPYITAPIAIGLIFATLFDQNFGAVNLFLKGIGVINKNVNWLPHSGFFKAAGGHGYNLALCGIYGSHLSGRLTKASQKDIYEAAKADGASTPKAIIYVILPMLKPILIFQITNGIIGCLKIFEEPLMLFGDYKGGVNSAAQTMNMKFLDTAF
ncbi:MAG: carbohydrate ABC transporter permease [Blautia sp.]